MSDEMLNAVFASAESARLNRTAEGSPFKPGDVVQMKKVSGPWMTVEHVRSVNAGTFLVSCVWFDKRRKTRRDTFDDFALEMVRLRPLPAPDLEPGQVQMVTKSQVY